MLFEFKKKMMSAIILANRCKKNFTLSTYKREKSVFLRKFAYIKMRVDLVKEHLLNKNLLNLA